MILVDTNILLDLIGRDPVWVGWSRNELRAAAVTDELAINEVVYAELAAGYRRAEDVDDFIERGGISLRADPRRMDSR
jgi:predicted nucleic acid-binding protein